MDRDGFIWWTCLASCKARNQTPAPANGVPPQFVCAGCGMQATPAEILAQQAPGVKF